MHALPEPPPVKRVLVVDDLALIHRVAARTLEAVGFAVEGVESSDEAIKLLHRQSFDVLVTDVYMPDGDGFELLSHVREHFPELKIVVMSGRFSIDSYGTALMHSLTDLGAHAVLMKPFRPSDLLDAIEQAISTA